MAKLAALLPRPGFAEGYDFLMTGVVTAPLCCCGFRVGWRIIIFQPTHMHSRRFSQRAVCRRVGCRRIPIGEVQLNPDTLENDWEKVGGGDGEKAPVHPVKWLGVRSIVCNVDKRGRLWCASRHLTQSPEAGTRSALSLLYHATSTD